jgi:hypothetical protein
MENSTTASLKSFLGTTISAAGGRKFLHGMLTSCLAAFLCYTGHMGDTVAAYLMGLAITVYSTSNVAQKKLVGTTPAEPTAPADAAPPSKEATP